MADNKKERALEVYNTLREAMKIQEWHYNSDDEKMIIDFTVNGDDIPMHFVIVIDDDRELVRLYSRLPFKMAEEHRVDGAIATCQANYKLVDGSFDYTITDGTIDYRMTSSYRDSVISTDMLLYMVNYATGAVDEYNDKFMLISKGALSIDDFLNSLE